MAITLIGTPQVDQTNNGGASTDFPLSGTIPDLTNYKDASNVISSRVYHEAT